MANDVVLSFGAGDFCLYARRNTAAENPDLVTFAHQHISEEQPEISLIGICVIKELGIQQMRRDRDIAFVDSKAAVSAGSFGIGIDISAIGRTHIDQRSELPLFLPLDIGECLVGRRVGIPFGV